MLQYHSLKIQCSIIILCRYDASLSSCVVALLHNPEINFSRIHPRLMGAMFPLPRILYAMGSDGVIFRFLGAIHPRFHTPVLGTALSGIFAGNGAASFGWFLYDMRYLHSCYDALVSSHPPPTTLMCGLKKISYLKFWLIVKSRLRLFRRDSIPRPDDPTS